MLRPSFVVLLALTTLGATARIADAQCCAPAAVPTAVPTVAYSPVVYQQAPGRYNGWYPGKYLINFTRGLFNAPAAYSAGYAPAYAPSYAGGAYTAGYAPAYSARYAAYRPTYPLTYGAVQHRAAYAPLTYSVARPVTLAPVTSACCNTCGVSTCHGGCDNGIAQAAYAAPLASSGCSSCQSGGNAYYDSSPSRNVPSSSYSEPRPALAPSDNPAADRSLLNKPALPEVMDGATEASDASGGAYWQAPPLFDPRDRLTQHSAAPVRLAVHKQVMATSPEPRAPRQQPLAPRQRGAHQTGSTGWTSASR